ncbi:hypothetical protein CO229_01020 [Mycoplasmopsis bovirhinis]|uniref:hypothetical protein n=1 Tax=Mycoplasmopsis bovirhinis TaxID=29553 RepID=UPI000C059861|nr:hypothetical protein [Mycoplasmopsis bovirhinis]ATO30702.1 hypothetical protein CO229_01020 [Mycoplasmopsis bovirhinis]
MKLTKFYKLLNITKIEKELSFNRKMTKKEIWLRLISFCALIFSLLCAIAFSFLNPSYEFKLFYIFTYGLIFGGAIWFVLALWFLVWLLKVLNKKLENKCFAWWSRRFKVTWWNFKKQLLKVILVSFLISLLTYHLVLHFLDQNLLNFDFKLSNYSNIYLYGWWNNFYNLGLKDQTQSINDNLTNNYSISNNIGFFFDSIFNLLYLISLSYILPIIIIVILTTYLIKLLFFPILRFRTKNKIVFSFKLSLLNEKLLLINSKKFFVYSNQTKYFYEFLTFLESKIINFRMKDNKLKTLLKELKSHPVQDYLNEFQNLQIKIKDDFLEFDESNDFDLDFKFEESIFKTDPFNKSVNNEHLEPKKTLNNDLASNLESSIIDNNQLDNHWLDKISPINKGE